MDAAEPSSRRWISLPALLAAAVLAFLVGYSAYVVHWAREREGFLASECVVYPADDGSAELVVIHTARSPGPRWPWQLWLLHRLGPQEYVGDSSPVEQFVFFGERPKSLSDRAHELFPEAELVVRP